MYARILSELNKRHDASCWIQKATWEHGIEFCWWRPELPQKDFRLRHHTTEICSDYAEMSLWNPLGESACGLELSWWLIHLSFLISDEIQSPCPPNSDGHIIHLHGSFRPAWYRRTRNFRSGIIKVVCHVFIHAIVGSVNFHQITRECGNVHDKELVNLTAKSVYNIAQPKNTLEIREEDSFYLSKNQSNLWICRVFEEIRVLPTRYSVMSTHWLPGHVHLKSRVIEVSNDGTKNLWTEIDRRDNNTWTTNSRLPHSRVPNESSRFSRLKQTGKNITRIYSQSLLDTGMLVVSLYNSFWERNTN